MKRHIVVWLAFIQAFVFSEEIVDNAIDPMKENNYEEDAYYDFGWDEGITVYAERIPDPDEEYIIERLNGSLNERERFIKEQLLEKAGFRGTAKVKFRQTTGSEKASSVLHGVTHVFSFGIVPIKPFFEVEYDSLPQGEFYRFESVLVRSSYKNVSKIIRICMELEYLLQVEFCNGVVIRDWNTKYYTEENIRRFERLAMSLPDAPKEIAQLKDRYIHRELPNIKSALERYTHPSENVLQAKRNLGDSLLRFTK